VTKAIQNILSLFPHSIRDPFFVLESKGKIISTNKQGYSFLGITDTKDSIINYFEPDSKDMFNKLLDRAVEKNDKLVLEHIEFNLISGKKVNAQIIFNTLEISGELIILCTIIPKNYTVKFTDISRIKISNTDIKSNIKNEDLLEIINKAETFYPITFIGKELVHKLADKLEDIFWIADNKGNFLLVNEYFAKSLGLKPLQMEGKSADEFIPGFLKELNYSINKFIKETMNCVVTEGVHLRENENLKDKEIIQLPLFDEEKKLQAVIGFSQYSESKIGEKTDEEQKQLRELDKDYSSTLTNTAALYLERDSRVANPQKVEEAINQLRFNKILVSKADIRDEKLNEILE